MEQFTYAKTEQGLTAEEIKSALLASLEGRDVKKALLIPPDCTRFHSNAGFITNVYYHTLLERGAEVDILPAWALTSRCPRSSGTPCLATFPLRR